LTAVRAGLPFLEREIFAQQCAERERVTFADVIVAIDVPRRVGFAAAATQVSFFFFLFCFIFVLFLFYLKFFIVFLIVHSFFFSFSLKSLKLHFLFFPLLSCFPVLLAPYIHINSILIGPVGSIFRMGSIFWISYVVKVNQLFVACKPPPSSFFSFFLVVFVFDT
jgi:hypothetical protein